MNYDDYVVTVYPPLNDTEEIRLDIDRLRSKLLDILRECDRSRHDLSLVKKTLESADVMLKLAESQLP